MEALSLFLVPFAVIGIVVVLAVDMSKLHNVDSSST